VYQLLLLFAAVISTYLVGAAQFTEEFQIVETAPGVYVHFGAQEEISAENLGDIANIGFIVGDDSVIVIDTGGSLAVGKNLYKKMREITGLPVKYIVHTHIHPDHVFGVKAFEQENAQLVGHERLANAVVQRGDFYTQRLLDIIGDAAQGSKTILPDLTVNDSLEIDLGNRIVTVSAFPTAHTDNDLIVFDQKTQTLWTGDLLFIERTPSLDGSIVGWLDAIEKLESIPAKRVIPGHGPVSTDWPNALHAQQHYLQIIADGTREAIRSRQSIQHATETVGVSEQHKWLLFDTYNPHNVTKSFSELEWE